MVVDLMLADALVDWIVLFTRSTTPFLFVAVRVAAPSAER
jgi:hypothetical protein